MGTAVFNVDRGEWFRLLMDTLQKSLPIGTSIVNWKTVDDWDTITFTITHPRLPDGDDNIEIENPLRGPQFIINRTDSQRQQLEFLYKNQAITTKEYILGKAKLTPGFSEEAIVELRDRLDKVGV